MRARSSRPTCGPNIPDSGCCRFGTSFPGAGQKAGLANGLVNARSGQAAPRPGGEPLRQVAVLSDGSRRLPEAVPRFAIVPDVRLSSWKPVHALG